MIPAEGAARKPVTRDGSRVGIDVGGTFTDLVLLHEGSVRIHKLSTTADDQSRAVVAGLQALDLDAAQIVHGMTVATNALLERKGARTALLTTPVEALELAYPFRIERYGLRAGSGGNGTHRGGDGIVRAYLFLEAATVTMLSERRTVAPWGAAGGEPGAVGRNLLVCATGEHETLPAKFSRSLKPGDRLIIETPGGGGWGTV